MVFNVLMFMLSPLGPIECPEKTMDIHPKKIKWAKECPGTLSLLAPKPKNTGEQPESYT